MSSEVGIKIQQDSISICVKDAELDCRYFSNHGIHNGWAKRRWSQTNSFGI